MIAGASGGSGFEIEQSVRFERADTSYMSWTPGGAPTSRRLHTFSWWLKRTQLGVAGSFGHYLFATAGTQFFINIDTNHKLSIYHGSGTLTTNAAFLDMSAWYHVVLAIDTTQATASDRVRLYVNGVEQSFTGSAYPAQNADEDFGHTVAQYLGYSSINQPFDGYMAEVIVVDGQQLAPTAFGKTDPQTGQWVPVNYEGTYGTNGFHLDFADSGDLGADVSGNSNNLTPSGITSDDYSLDSPTNNFCILDRNRDIRANFSIVEGGLYLDGYNAGGGQAGRCAALGTFSLSSRKWFFEVEIASATSIYVGVVDEKYQPATRDIGLSSDNDVWLYIDTGDKIGDSAQAAYGDTYTTGDYIYIALDMDNGAIWFGKKSGSAIAWQASATKSEIEAGTTTNAAFTSLTGNVCAAVMDAQGNGEGLMRVNFGQVDWAVDSSEVPSGFNAMCENNLPTPSIVDSTKHAATLTYVGTGADGNNITGLSFAPDIVSIKSFDTVTAYIWYDRVRGAGKFIRTDSASAEITDNGDELVSFNADGFTLDEDATALRTNKSGDDYHSIALKCGGAGGSNSDGSITATVSANVPAGMSIVKYTGDGSSGATVGHGLGAAPKMVWVRNLSSGADNMPLYHEGMAADAETDYINIDTGGGPVDNVNRWNDTAPTATVVTLGNSTAVNGLGSNYIMYCWAEVEGFSKLTHYTGDASTTDGPFIHCGFAPEFVMVKNAVDSGYNLRMWSNTTDGNNPHDNYLAFNSSTGSFTAGTNSTGIAFFTANGVKVRGGGTTDPNGTSDRHIVWAFAKSPFKYANAV